MAQKNKLIGRVKKGVRSPLLSVSPRHWIMLED
jgi:hypothetical protein